MGKRILGPKNITNQVRFLGQLKFEDYVDWILSDCHVYLTHPFVASWSLVEAYCCGVPLITSDIEAVRNMRNFNDVVYADHRDMNSY